MKTAMNILFMAVFVFSHRKTLTYTFVGLILENSTTILISIISDSNN